MIFVFAVVTITFTDGQPCNSALFSPNIMKIAYSKHVRFLSVLCLTVWAVGPRAVAQTPAELDIQLYAGLTITGAVGTVYQIQYVTDLAQTNNATAWRCQEFLQLPANPYLWADKSAPATGKRFYRAVQFDAPINLALALNLLSDNSVAVANAQQYAPINQGI